MGRLRLRVRLTVWYTLVLVFVVAAFGADVIWSERRVGIRRVDRELESVSALVAGAIDEGLNHHRDVQTAAEGACHTATLPGIDMAVFNAQSGYAICGGNGPFPGPPPVPTPSVRMATTVEVPSGDWRVLTEPRVFGDRTLVIRVARPLTDVRRAQHEVLEAMQVAIPLVLLLAGGGGLWLAAVGLRPITDMARIASEMGPAATNDLGYADRQDELGQLARAFNGLLARLRTSLTTQRQFMADASHELRTPVSVIRSAADVALGRDHRAEQEYREALSISGGQARHLSRLVEQMLVLARADAGGYPMRLTDVYLDETIDDCRRAVEVMARTNGITLSVPPASDIVVEGDEELLRQLVLNVVLNAVQHTRPQGQVTFEIQQDPERVVIRVADGGPGIAVADQARIFDRFVQLDPARRHLGAGLGLPIARWIADAHGGSLVLEKSGPFGSVFRINLPRRRAVAASA